MSGFIQYEPDKGVHISQACREVVSVRNVLLALGDAKPHLSFHFNGVSVDVDYFDTSLTIEKKWQAEFHLMRVEDALDE